MHQRSVYERQGASDPQTPQDRASLWSSKLRTQPTPRCPAGGACSWAWLLLLLGGSLLVPGAWSFLSDEQEELLVELHNYFRGQVSPSASAMMPLVRWHPSTTPTPVARCQTNPSGVSSLQKWDASLKVIAEGYAAKCIWNHNPDLEETGENLFAGTGQLDLRAAVEKWFMEHLDYDFYNNSCDEDKMCGHYTQMVWADTHRMGCAFHLCNNMEGLDWERASFLVCNYYPAGNYEEERPYVEGDWCSGCPVNLQKCENNLCVPDLEEDEPEDDDTNNGTSFPPTLSPGVTLSETEELAEEHPTSSSTPASTTELLPTRGPEDGDTPPPGTSSETNLPPGASSSRPSRQEEKEEQSKKVREESIIRKEEVWEKTKPAMTSSAASMSTSILTGLLTGLLTLRL
nr:peptidase inhibitor 16 isoform X1 [Nothobranchius furzeri]